MPVCSPDLAGFAVFAALYSGFRGLGEFIDHVGREVKSSTNYPLFENLWCPFLLLLRRGDNCLAQKTVDNSTKDTATQ